MHKGRGPVTLSTPASIMKIMARPVPPEGRERYRNPRPGVVAGCPSGGLWLIQSDVDRGNGQRCHEDFTVDAPDHA